jgi:SAM-dependent methyltransferase/uncharacterized protein YbaR (Trm112 family)
MDQWLRDNLVCPRDHGQLALHDNVLTCADGHRYPVVDGVPVMLLDEVEQTLWVASASLEKSGAANGSNPLNDRIPFADTLGISEDEYEKVLQMPLDGVDPVVQMSLGRTCGNLYSPLVGNLKTYPIPELRLPDSTGEKFLDVGCNWGRWCIPAARKGYDVVGIDPSIGAVFAARRVCAQLGVKAQFVVGDGRYLPFKPGVFDVVYCYSVLQHFSKENARMALTEMARVLRAGGRSLVQMPNFYGIRCLINNARRGFAAGEGFDVRFWRPAEMRKTFSNIVGKTKLSVDGYFGLGVQEGDADLLPSKFRLVVRCSGVLRRLSTKLPFMKVVADSIFVHSTRNSGG